jgi:hypothetical protein
VRNHPKLVILAAGRSNSIYLHGGGADAFINPGSDSKYRRITQPFLRYQGVNRLRLFQSYRQDADHEGCLRQLERQFTCVSAKNGIATQLELVNGRFEPDTDSTVVNLDETGIRVRAAPPNRSASRILVGMGGYWILLMADSHHGSSLDKDDCTVDLLCVSSPRSFPPADIQSRYNPQVVVYTQGKRSERSARSPTLFLSEDGAVTLELCGDALKLQTYRGGQFTFRKRN